MPAFAIKLVQQGHRAIGGLLAQANHMNEPMINRTGKASVAAAELHEQVAAWVNEGGSWDRERAMLHVLVIEDEVIIGMLLARILMGMGHDVAGVEATEQGAVAATARMRPGLILVDERLRAGTGHAAMERILRDGFIPHVWMSGAPLDQANPGPGVAVLQKPFTERDLSLAIAQVLRPASRVASVSDATRVHSDDASR